MATKSKENTGTVVVGIVVCDRWLNSFTNFFEDMGHRPSVTHSVERINNEENYSCGKCDQCLANGWTANCYWATPKEQARNRCDNRNITFNGVTQCLKDWATATGIHGTTLASRLDRGWPIEEALTTPARAIRHKSKKC
jgi:hypothetical protein